MDQKLLDLSNILNDVSGEVRERFSGLSARQLNWKPSPGQWSIGQCFDHLLIGNREMASQIELKVRGGKPTFFEKIPLLPRLFGPLVVNSVSPVTARKTKNPKILDPSASDLPGDIVAKFLESQEKIAEAMKASDNIDVEKTIMTSPVAKFVTYSMLDGFRITVYHAQRHLAQAKRVTETAGFPGADRER
jgi:DinB superfamily